MKRTLFLSLFALFCLVGAVSATAQATAPVGPEQVNSFDVEMALNRGDDLTVNERITYDFGLNQRHGIYRYIPHIFVVGYRKIDVGLRLLSAFRDDQAEPIQEKHEGEQTVLRLGREDETISGIHEYLLIYRFGRTVVATPTGQRLSWNVTGNGWTVPIKASTLRLDAPAAPTDVACFTGGYGEKEKNCTVSVSGTQVTARLTKPLDRYEGWTVDITYPPDTFIPAATDEEPLFPWLAPWMIFSALFSAIWLILWVIFGRDAKGRGTIIAEYGPPTGAKPYLVNALEYDGINHRGLAATILDLTRRNVMRLTMLDDAKDFLLERDRSQEKGLDPYETSVIEMLFVDGDELHGLSQNRKQALLYTEGQVQVNKLMHAQGLHQWNIGFIRGLSLAIAVVSWAVCMLVLHLFVYDPYLLMGISGLVVGCFFAYHLPKRTRAGALIYEHIQGFKRYIHVAEKDRLAFHEAPSRTPDRFSALLPFAVALGLEKAWGKIFEGITLAPGTESGNSAFLSAVQVSAFAHALSDQSRSLATTNTGNGGSGGFSGGGAGGGGGGSW